LWSLACEMQFYLIAPVIYLMGNWMAKRKDLWFGFLLIVLVGLGMAQPLIGKWKYHFEFAVWPMMLGFCCEYKRHWFQRVPRTVVRPVLWLSVAICGASMALMVIGFEIKLVVIAVGGLLLAPCWLAYRFGYPMAEAAGRPMRWMGERTYSIYLWQQPFTICNYLPPWWHPLGALIATGVGAVWFRLFEFPFLSVNRRKQEIKP